MIKSAADIFKKLSGPAWGKYAGPRDVYYR